MGNDTHNNEQEVRLKILGQIAVMRDRLNVLEASLIKRPAGNMYYTEDVSDAIGNLSFQTGVLMGLLTTYTEVAPK